MQLVMQTKDVKLLLAKVLVEVICVKAVIKSDLHSLYFWFVCNPALVFSYYKGFKKGIL